jgi:hypothetical protein
MRHIPRRAAALVGCAILAAALAAAPAPAQDKVKVYRNITPGQVENILNDLGVKFTKTQPKNLPNDWDFDFDRTIGGMTYKVRFTVANGKLLWLSAFFPKNEKGIDKMNEWNVQAKFSRAVQDRVGDREYSIVESQIDAAGGVTEDMIRQFIRRFDDEVSRFDAFLKK